MKLIAGHKYLKSDTGGYLPYSELLEKVSGFEVYIPKETYVNDKQFEQNEKIRPASEKMILGKEPVRTAPTVKKMVHHDITAEMQQDLAE